MFFYILVKSTSRNQYCKQRFMGLAAMHALVSGDGCSEFPT